MPLAAKAEYWNRTGKIDRVADLRGLAELVRLCEFKGWICKGGAGRISDEPRQVLAPVDALFIEGMPIAFQMSLGAAPPANR